MVHLALYQPDIPQNVGAAMRLCACLDVPLDIIEPCGFPWDERKIRKSGMDYIEGASLQRYKSWEDFTNRFSGKQRIILLTTKSAMNYTDFNFRADDILLAGQESRGAPDFVHETADGRLVIPMKQGMRSLNIVNSAAIVLGEALRQTGGFSQ